jgi:hypothetical protein
MNLSERPETLGDQIRARRDARNKAITELRTHLDEHFEKLHARLDKLEKQ